MAIVGGIASVGSAFMGADASRKAAHTQADAAREAQAQQMEMQKPWMEAGKTALQQLTAGTQPGGQFAGQFTMADAQNSEAMKEALRSGSDVIQSSAAARGGLLGTNTLQELTKFGQATGAQYENQAFNQWLANRQANLQPLQSLAQIGQSTTTGVADNISNLTLGAGSANAAGIVGQANAMSTVPNQISMLAGLFGTGGGGGTSYTTPNIFGNYSNPTTGSGGIGIDPGGLLGGAKTAGDYSDERLKEDVKEVGSTHDGLPIYTYRMKGGGPIKMGVMAQHVRETKPDAVSSDRHGMLMVDYGRI